MDEEIEQYKQHAEDWRHLNNIIWQIPSLTVTVGAILIAGSYQLSDNIARGIILLLGTILSFSLLVALVKHRYFHNKRTELLESIETKWKEEGKLRLIQSRITGKDAKGLEKASAVWFLYFSIGILTVIELILAVISFIN